MLQDEILKIGEYFNSIEHYGDGLIVKVTFPQKWITYPSDDGKVRVTEKDGSIFYFGNINDGVKLEDIFALINNTIETNKSVALKIQMLKERVEELKQLFNDLPISDLENLKFVIEKPKKKETKKRAVKKSTVKKKEEKKAEVENVEITEEKKNDD
jgi:hypothetical protein